MNLVQEPSDTGSNIAMEQIIRIMHLWSTKTPLGKMMVEVEVSLQYKLLVYLHLKPLPLTGRCSYSS